MVPCARTCCRRAGANVIKVESISRPDGAREGEKTFYALLNQGKTAITFNPDRPDSTARLHALLSRADIVVEAAAPARCGNWVFRRLN
ncbi:MAG: CoA transferase [Pseudomonadales bacterium]